MGLWVTHHLGNSFRYQWDYIWYIQREQMCWMGSNKNQTLGKIGRNGLNFTILKKCWRKKEIFLGNACTYFHKTIFKFPTIYFIFKPLAVLQNKTQQCLLAVYIGKIYFFFFVKIIMGERRKRWREHFQQKQLQFSKAFLRKFHFLRFFAMFAHLNGHHINPLFESFKCQQQTDAF